MFSRLFRQAALHDPLRPHHQPAQGIYDAFVTESRQRVGRPVEVWIAAERQAVQDAARKLAPGLGLRVPTLAEIARIEDLSTGADYGAKLAIRVADAMAQPG